MGTRILVFKKEFICHDYWEIKVQKDQESCSIKGIYLIWYTPLKEKYHQTNIGSTNFYGKQETTYEEWTKHQNTKNEPLRSGHHITN